MASLPCSKHDQAQRWKTRGNGSRFSVQASSRGGREMSGFVPPGSSDTFLGLGNLEQLRSMSAIVSPLSTVRDPPSLDICGVFVWCGWMRTRYLADKSVIVSVPVDEANTKATGNNLSKDTKKKQEGWIPGCSRIHFLPSRVSCRYPDFANALHSVGRFL